VSFKIKVVSALVVCIVAIATIKFFQIKKAMEEGAAFAPPPDAVSSSVAKRETWRPSVRSVGSLTPIKGVTITAEEPGKLLQIGFESGSTVKAGELLFQIDTSVEEAELGAALAQAEWYATTLKRNVNLRRGDVLSQADVDATQAQVKQAQGQAAAIRAKIARKKIVAPFDGVVGIREVNVGDYIWPGKTLVPLHSLESLYVNFTVAQQDIGSLHQGQAISLMVEGLKEVDGKNDRQFAGTISAVNPNVDVATRTLAVQATVSNPSLVLKSGMFATVQVALDSSREVIPLPASAIVSAPYGDSVFVIDKGAATEAKGPFDIRQQFIKVGERRGDRVAVVDGIKEGEEVVISGAFKLRQGVKVVVDNSKVAPSSENPNLTNS
jgi:membrane fusion protein, multidrug efflux system